MFESKETIPTPRTSAFSNLFSYLDFPISRSVEQLNGAVVMGVPYDLATSARPGARYGPAGIRRASAQLGWEARRYPWEFKLKDKLKIIDYGDIELRIGDSQHMHELVSATSTYITGQGNFLLTFGGDHYVSLPLIEGICRNVEKVSLIHFDAHSDTEQVDLEYYHGSMFHRAIKQGLIDPTTSIQLGLRTEHNSTDLGLTVVDADWLHNHSAEQAVARIRAVVGQGPVYISIDIDCLDPAYAPGTGTPVVGGISTATLLQILRGLRGLPLLAADVMEVSPPYDHADLTTLAAATLGLELLHVYAAAL